MLDRKQYDDAMKSVMAAGLAAGVRGNFRAAMITLTSLMTTAWEITRPEMEFHELDVSDAIPEDMRHLMKNLRIAVVVDDKGEVVMGFGDGTGTAGEDMRTSTQMTTAQHEFIGRLCDELLRKHFGHFNLDKVMSVDEFMVQETRKTIDTQVSEFREELDSLFDTWRGGES